MDQPTSISSPQLTAVITFRNEGQLLADTVAGIRQTAGRTVAIHLIDDASDDDFDYHALAKTFNCRIDRFDESRGPAANRNFGVDQADTPYVICFDAHMRFYDSDWATNIIAAIQQDPNALYCTVSRPLNIEGNRMDGPDGYGASLEHAFDKPDRLLVPSWNVTPLDHCAYPMIPLPLGATYAFAVDFFQEIGGYVGLKHYGGEEAYAGMKAWLFGGRCRLIRDVTIGHIYRGAEERPWQSAISCYLFNRVLLAAILFSAADLNRYLSALSGLPDYQRTLQMFRDNQGFISNLRDFVQARCLYDTNYFFELNAAFVRDHHLESYFEGALESHA